MKSIRRKTLLYRSAIGGYCINHALGCSHGCKYPCHGFLLKQRHGAVASYQDWCEPKIVENALDLLDNELPRLLSKLDSVHMCLSTDPFMCGQPEIHALTLEILKKLYFYNIPCHILTKGILPPELADTKLYSPANTYGISLVSLDEGFRKEYEPGAAPYRERVAALKRLHDLGCRTRVQMEPYPTPNIVRQDIIPILESIKFANTLVFGRLNYNRLADTYTGARQFYAETADTVAEFCRAHGIDCHLIRQ